MKFSPMHLFDQLLLAGPTWIGVSVTVAAIVLVHVVRRFLSQDQKGRGKITLLWFYLALAFRVSAAVALRSGGYTSWVLLSFLDLISCALGIIGLVRLLDSRWPHYSSCRYNRYGQRMRPSKSTRKPGTTPSAPSLMQPWVIGLWL